MICSGLKVSRAGLEVTLIPMLIFASSLSLLLLSAVRGHKAATEKVSERLWGSWEYVFVLPVQNEGIALLR